RSRSRAPPEEPFWGADDMAGSLETRAREARVAWGEGRRGAPRSLWNGTIACGLVTVPVKVFTATESKTVRFHEVHVTDGSRIEHRRICPKDGEEIDYDHIVKGFEVRKGEWV